MGFPRDSRNFYYRRSRAMDAQRLEDSCAPKTPSLPVATLAPRLPIILDDDEAAELERERRARAVGRPIKPRGER